jgi:mannose-6-phosphate isomerase class I
MNTENNIKKAIDDYFRKPVPLKLKCEIMDSSKGYYWGDKKFIPKLLNINNPGNKAFAELWIGAHKNAPAKTIINGIELSLFDLIEKAGKKILGENVIKKFGNTLPFLLIFSKTFVNPGSS